MHQRKHCPGLKRANLEALARSPSEEDISTDLPPIRQEATLTTPGSPDDISPIAGPSQSPIQWRSPQSVENVSKYRYDAYSMGLGMDSHISGGQHPKISYLTN